MSRAQPHPRLVLLGQLQILLLLMRMRMELLQPLQTVPTRPFSSHRSRNAATRTPSTACSAFWICPSSSLLRIPATRGSPPP